MALFTESQVNACTITKVKKMMVGDTCSWGLGVKDADGNHYDWTNQTLAVDASKDDIKVAVKAKLLELDKKPAIILTSVVTLDESDDKGLGETLG
jgi:hypothetical protein